MLALPCYKKEREKYKTLVTIKEEREGAAR
jgi:hypothetical protein